LTTERVQIRHNTDYYKESIQGKEITYQNIVANKDKAMDKLTVILAYVGLTVGCHNWGYSVLPSSYTG
jgi:hypothetical protein